jgi:hypothetical protein
MNEQLPDFLQALLSGQVPQGAQFTKPKAYFDLDKEDRIKKDPTTGKKIKPKDRRTLRKFLQNPNMLNPANAINVNAPGASNDALAGLGALIMGGGQ